MGRVLLKGVILVFFVLFSISFFSPLIFAAHPLYSSFSSASGGFTFNQESKIAEIKDTIIYNTGYYSINGSAWVGFNLSGSSNYNGDVNWLNGSASKSLPDFGFGEHYIIVYSCTYANSSWNCHENMWQLIVINNTLPTPNFIVTASSYEEGNNPENVLDGNLNTRWSSEGIGEWIQFSFNHPQTINQVSVAFASGDSRLAYFNISVSSNGFTWSNVFSGQSSGTSLQLQNFSIDNVTALYLRIVGLGNSISLWNSYTEISWGLVSDSYSNCTANCSGKQCGDDGCGESCGVCINPHGSTSCSGAGLCVPVCSTGYGNCDSNDVNGCETQLGTTSNCGSCGNACSVDQTCTNYVCISPTSTFCGDGGCNGAESCSSCPSDCGSCQTDFLRTFYVSNNGDDAKDGLSSSTAWKTISKINGRTFMPGDAVLFERGGVWRETLEVPSGGNRTNYLYFGNYGNEENPKPRILGSKNAFAWTETSSGSHIWKSDVTFSNPDVADAVFKKSDGSGRFGVKKSSTSGLTAEYNWAYSSGYIYVYSLTNPGAMYSEIEIPQRNYCVSTNDKPYLHFNGLDCFYAGYTGYDSNNDHTISDVSGMIIENCEIGFVGGQTVDDIGFCISTIYSDMIIRNNEIYHCGRRGIALDVYNEGSKFTVENILVENNRIYNGYHTTGVDIDVGAVGSSNINNLTIRNNWIYEETSHTSDFSNMIFIQNNYVSGCDITNIYIYNNIFQRANGAGIMAEGIEGPIYVYNNIFYDHDPNAQSWMAYIMPQTKDGQKSNSIAKNNIFYGGDSSSFGAMEVWGSWNQHDYNLFYNAGSVSESHGVNGNPLFINPAYGNFNLNQGSPAIGKGVNVGLTVDMEGQAYNSPPSIGAFEYP